MGKVFDRYGAYIFAIIALCVLIGFLIALFVDVHRRNLKDEACRDSGGLYMVDHCWYGCSSFKSEEK